MKLSFIKWLVLHEPSSPSAHTADDFWFQMGLRFALSLTNLFTLKLRRYKLKYKCYVQRAAWKLKLPSLMQLQPLWSHDQGFWEAYPQWSHCRVIAPSFYRHITWRWYGRFNFPRLLACISDLFSMGFVPVPSEKKEKLQGGNPAPQCTFSFWCFWQRIFKWPKAKLAV